MYLFRLGKILGYPKCCIKAFSEDKQVKDTIFKGTGFVPCKKHAEMSPGEVITEVNRNRRTQHPFPFNGNPAHNISYLGLASPITKILEELYGRDIRTLCASPSLTIGLEEAKARIAIIRCQTLIASLVKDTGQSDAEAEFMEEIKTHDPKTFKLIALEIINKHLGS